MTRAAARPAPTFGLSRIWRYVMEEVLPITLAGVVVVILLLLLGAVYAVIAPLLAKGASPGLVVQLVALNIPDAIARGLPIGLLFGVLLGFARLSQDAEIKAMLAGGLGWASLFGPVMLLAGLVALVSFAVGEGVRPRALERAAVVQREIVLDNPRVLGLGQLGTVFTDALGRAISVGKVGPGGTFEDIRVVQTAVGQPPHEVLIAQSGRLDARSATLELGPGQRITYQGGRPSTVATFAGGSLRVQDLKTSLDAQTSPTLPINLPLPTLLARVQSLSASHASAGPELTALNRKFAEPLAALAFAFFGVALALYSFRSGTGLGLPYVMLLTFAYYATWSVFRVMGEQGAINPALAAWAPDALYLLAGLALLGLAQRR